MTLFSNIGPQTCLKKAGALGCDIAISRTWAEIIASLHFTCYGSACPGLATRLRDQASMVSRTPAPTDRRWPGSRPLAVLG